MTSVNVSYLEHRFYKYAAGRLAHGKYCIKSLRSLRNISETVIYSFNSLFFWGGGEEGGGGGGRVYFMFSGGWIQN